MCGGLHENQTEIEKRIFCDKTRKKNYRKIESIFTGISSAVEFFFGLKNPNHYIVQLN